ncbi:MAG: fibronectin type III protein [uncultured bacterium (gcode 4)]|uniref:Fibronectin type III protein n=1 Tax=uncultured bacterium (gcode 4) TaxID=1234023 RepID=K2H303_9BACT|nr:MAG: fibronectin type III protein [uncultured bacterium (gcode 4)]
MAPYVHNLSLSWVTNGLHTLTAKARDAAGNSTISAQITINVLPQIMSDTQAPSISLISPADNSVVKGTVILSSSWTDNIWITGVRYMLDWVEIGPELISAPYSYSLNTLSGITNWPHKIIAKARDAAMNSGTSPEITINVSNSVADIIVPTAAWNEPPANATISGAVLLSVTATDNVWVTWLMFFVDNIPFGSGSVGTWSLSDYTLTIDSTTLTNWSHSLYAEAYDLAKNIWKTSMIQVNVNNPVPDAIAPVVSITSPRNWAILTWTSSITISATDNIGVEFVHYSVTNGKDEVIWQIASAPFVIHLSSGALLNGSHTISVYAQDKAGNIWNAAPVNFNTFNAPTEPLAPNLILNPSLETWTWALPDYWYTGNWGTNTSIFKYPVPWIDWLNAADLNISAYTDGDAKWYFEDVAVVPWKAYTFSDQYISTTTSTLTARFTTSTGTLIYVDIVSNLPASATWVTTTQTVTIPADVAKMTIFHLVNSVWSLTVDNMSLRLSSAWSSWWVDPNGFPTGMVSLTFDDWWGSQYDNALPILNWAGLKGSFFIITNEMKNAINANRISNPSFEVVSPWNDPSDWISSKSGVNDAAFEYPVTWVSGGKASKVSISSYTSWDAKWQFNNTTVANGEMYNFTDQYIATVPTTVTVEYTLNNGTIQIVDLGTVKASPTWAIASFTFTPPTNVKSLTIYHRISSIGSLTTDDHHLDLSQDYMNMAQVQDMYRSGQEVSSHTQTHPFLTQLTPEKASAEIATSRQDLINVGITPSDTFVYPYGDYNAAVIQTTKDAWYIGARSVDEWYNNMLTDKYALKIQQVNNTTTPEQWESWTQTAIANHTWLILMFHQVDQQNDQYGARPEDLQTYVDYLKSNWIPTVTLKQWLEMMVPQ